MNNHKGILQAVVAVLLAAILSSIGWTFGKISDHEVRISVHDAQMKTLVEILQRVELRQIEDARESR